MNSETPEKYTIIDDEKSGNDISSDIGIGNDTNTDVESTVSVENNHESIDYAILNSTFRRGPQKRSGLKLTSWLIMSAVVDHLVIIFNCCIFLIVSSLALKMAGQNSNVSSSIVDFIKPFLNKKELLSTAASVYFLVSLIYFVGFRVLIGATIGEWSCGIRIGQPYERIQTGYKLKIISRVFLILATGVVTIPLLSLIFKKDIAGLITKARLYTLR